MDFFFSLLQLKKIKGKVSVKALYLHYHDNSKSKLEL